MPFALNIHDSVAFYAFESTSFRNTIPVEEIIRIVFFAGEKKMYFKK